MERLWLYLVWEAARLRGDPQKKKKKGRRGRFEPVAVDRVILSGANTVLWTVLMSAGPG